MSDAAVTEVADTSEVLHTFWRDGWRALKRSWLFWVAFVIMFTFTLMAIAPGLFTFFSPAESSTSGEFCFLRDSRLSPSSEHWFGTDTQGCDYFTQVINGARVSMRVAIGATFISVVIGIVFGSLAGYYGGWTDTIISRIADGFLSMPYLVGAVLVLSVLASSGGRSEWDVMFAIGALGWPSVIRLYRSTVLQVRGLEYVQAARSLGASDIRIMARHILPNALTPVLVVSTVNMGVVIAVEATLSFFGVGLPLDSISWGVMMDEAIQRLEQSPHLFIFPGVLLTLASLGFVLMGEQLREAFDPRLR